MCTASKRYASCCHVLIHQKHHKMLIFHIKFNSDCIEKRIKWLTFAEGL